jgi:frataxin-like iron-binding protein CyaY
MNEAIAKLLDQLEKYDEIDIDIVEGGADILIKDLTYTIRMQEVISQIWVTSPITGPYHFIYKDNEWCSTINNNIKFFDIFFKELKGLMQQK